MKAIYKEIVSGASTFVCVTENKLPDELALEKTNVLIEIKACALAEQSNEIQKNVQKSNGSNRFAVGTDIAGIVVKVGSEVTTLSKGDEIVGVIPLDYNVSGCADYVLMHEFDVVKKPKQVSFVDAAGCVGDAVKAYTALHYLGRISSGDTVLIFDGASGFGSLAVQLAQYWGAKVISTSGSADEKLYLDGADRELALVIELNKYRPSLRRICMEETGGLGINIIIDNGVRMFGKDATDDTTLLIPNKQEIITSLAIGGRWITTASDLQIDPPNSHCLFMKCASIGYLFDQAWMLSSSQQGRYQHILLDIMEKVAEGTIRPNIHHVVSFDSTIDALNHLSDIRVGKVVMTTSL